ncbi:hypothetical protein [Tenacibaculum sp. UWU-22]|uniref:hypothetical protein n=1 Tax=Tenacibaculum sp. UWU-22 TaxID=3234187 RepID=UPI0034DB40AC
MKKGILLLLILTSIATINANDLRKSTAKIGVNNHNKEAVTFTEHGVEFYVFFNGNFDFNVQYQNNRYADYNGHRIRMEGPRRIFVKRDYKGRIRQVGNIYIHYDFRNNVTQIGSVHIDYNYGLLARVGHLTIDYDRLGIPHFYGKVKYYDNHYDTHFGTVYDYDDMYFRSAAFKLLYHKYKEDNNFYYYKARSDAKTGVHDKILKRRKHKTSNSFYKNDHKKNKSYNNDRNSNRRKSIKTR